MEHFILLDLCTLIKCHPNFDGHINLTGALYANIERHEQGEEGHYSKLDKKLSTICFSLASDVSEILPSALEQNSQFFLKRKSSEYLMQI